MSTERAYTLTPVVTDEQWSAFHAIRERVLFVDRLDGPHGPYDRNHPDDRKPDNHPVLLTCDGRPVGVMRIDLVPERSLAIMRLVAIATGEQRRGHGRAMVSLAERFARDRGCTAIAVFAHEQASGFYTTCGYAFETWDPVCEFGGGTQMRRVLG